MRPGAFALPFGSRSLCGVTDAPPASPGTAAPPAVEAPLGDQNGPGAWVQYFAARATLGFVGRLPDAWQRRLVGGAARLAMLVARERSEIARLYIRQALGCACAEGEGDARVLQAWRHFLAVTLDSNSFARRVPQARIAEHYDVELCPGFEEAVAEKRGGIFVTPHVGDWEAGSAMLPRVGCTPLYVIARQPRNRPLSAHLLRMRRERGIEVLPRRGGLDAVRALIDSGAWVAFLPDQRPRQRFVVAPFFGRPARTERGVGVLARRLGVPLAFGACYRTERPFHYRGVVARVLRPEQLAGMSVEALATLVNAEMERLILACPEQYFWLHERYRDDPPEAEGAE